jgi:hypothetical protein
MEDAQREYKDDVAFSFSGEERDYVDKVANILKDKGAKVFYDDFEKVILWGKDLAVHLDNIYNKDSRFAVLFISKSYKEKMWTRHEFRMALQRALSQKGEYILPAKFDDTKLDGLSSNIGFIDLKKECEESLSKIILQKLGRVPTEGGIIDAKSIPIISELNRRINKMIKSTTRLLPIPAGNKDEIEGKKKAENDIELFLDYLNVNRFFIDSKILSYADQISIEIRRYLNSLNIFYRRGAEQWGDSVKRSINIGQDVFDNKIPELQRNIEERVRNVYGDFSLEVSDALPTPTRE